MGTLYTRAGLTKSYYQARAQLQLPFNTNDLEALAAALGVTVEELAAPEPIPGGDIRLPAHVLSQRVRRLIVGQGATEQQLVSDLREIHPEFGRGAEEILRSTTGLVLSSVAMLEAVAQWADVDQAYLLDPTDGAIADRTDAELELRAVMKEVGASAIQFRALGEMSPDALRAIARSLRSKPAAP